MLEDLNELYEAMVKRWQEKIRLEAEEMNRLQYSIYCMWKDGEISEEVKDDLMEAANTGLEGLSRAFERQPELITPKKAGFSSLGDDQHLQS